MKKPVIAIDVDDVLAIENDAVRQFSNERYGHNHTPDDYRVAGEYWGYWQVVQGVDDEEFGRRYGEYLASGIKGELAVMAGAINTIAQLKKNYTLVIVTARDAHLVDITKEWLNRHFPDTFETVEFVAVWTGDVQASKSDICTSLEATYLIDDSPIHIHAAHNAGITGVLFGEYGWSRGVELPTGTVHCKDWQAIGEYFERQLQA